MKTIELKESDSTFIYYVLRQYGNGVSFDQEDRNNINELAEIFKSK